MFEILKALLDLSEACKAHDTTLHWGVHDDGANGLVLRADVPITEDDQHFVEDMQRMFAPVEG
jgi:hypothetical protein